jgi:GT2 family glycosyltransferase
MSGPYFSVIIPVYNSEETLSRAIDSVLSQRYPAHEVIVVDDGSTDDTPAVAARYGSRIRYMRQDNAGVAAARNWGAQVARGDWLAFLDADDWYYLDRLRLHAEWISEDERLDFLTGDYEYRQPDGSLISHSMEQHASGRKILEKSGGLTRAVMQGEELEDFVADHFGDTHTLSVPRKVFLELGGYPIGFKVCEDVYFLTKLCAQAHRVGVVCAPLAAYLIHDASATRSNPLAAQYENVRTLRALRAAAREFPPAVKRGVSRRLRSGRLNLGYALVRAGRRGQALQAVLPTLFEHPGIAGLRDALSMLKG